MSYWSSRTTTRILRRIGRIAHLTDAPRCPYPKHPQKLGNRYRVGVVTSPHWKGDSSGTPEMGSSPSDPANPQRSMRGICQSSLHKRLAEPLGNEYETFLVVSRGYLASKKTFPTESAQNGQALSNHSAWCRRCMYRKTGLS